MRSLHCAHAHLCIIFNVQLNHSPGNAIYVHILYPTLVGKTLSISSNHHIALVSNNKRQLSVTVFDPSYRLRFLPDFKSEHMYGLPMRAGCLEKS